MGGKGIRSGMAFLCLASMDGWV